MKNLLALLAISLVFLSSCAKKDTGSSESSLKADSVKLKNIDDYRAVIGIFNTGKFDELDKYFENTYQEHEIEPGQTPGLAGLKKQMGDFRAAFPDLKFTVNDIVAEGDKVWAHITMSGTNTGSFMGMPATGKSTSFQGVDIVRITNGKAVEHWGYYDNMKMMSDLGMMPPMGATEAKSMPAPEMKKGK